MPAPEQGTSSQRPSEQRCVEAHARPHAPQLAGSKRGSVQVAPHWVSPSRQVAITHAPSTHARPAPHALPQRPQCRTSCENCAQSAPHRSKPCWHVAGSQRPATHATPRSQGLPQAPQWSGLVTGSKHASPQRTRPAGQFPSSQRPSRQTTAKGHTTPQPPQLVRSLVVSTQTSPQSDAPVGHGPDASTPESRTIAPSGRTTGAPHAASAAAHKNQDETWAWAERGWFMAVLTGVHVQRTRPTRPPSSGPETTARSAAVRSLTPPTVTSRTPLVGQPVNAPRRFGDGCRPRGFPASRSARRCSRRFAW